MKKLTGFIAAAAIAITPMSSSALEALTDNAMNDVTGQAGVSIAIDDVVLFQKVGEAKYTDTDGITETPTWLYQDSATAGDPSYETSADAASLVISGKETLKIINGIWTSKEAGMQGELMATGYVGSKIFGGDDYDGLGLGHNAKYDGYKNKDLNMDGTFDIFVPSELKIDIGTCTTLSRAAQTKLTTVVGSNYLVNGETANGTQLGVDVAAPSAVRTGATVTGVVIGLPTVEITTTADSYTIGVEEVEDNDANLNSGKSFIKIEKGDSLMAILGGRLEIAPH